MSRNPERARDAGTNQVPKTLRGRLAQVQNMTPLQMEVGLKEAPPLSGRSLPPTPDGTSVTSRRRLVRPSVPRGGPLHASWTPNH